MITCKVCGFSSENLIAHILSHDLTNIEYNNTYGHAHNLSEALYIKYEAVVKTPLRKLSEGFSIYGVESPILEEVEEVLPLPNEYFFPRFGKLAEDLKQITTALKNKRSIYIWGPPGSGKDAFIHAYCAYTKTPSAIFSIIPGTDIQNWFWTRSFNKEGTYWETGRLLDMLRFGYKTKSGKQIPYLILISDFDRADRMQSEYLRLILDSIEGRIQGPQGEVYPVYPGTSIVATGNSAGSGDPRGRCISSNPIDASLFDRFERVFRFDWMSWEDEGLILKRKFSYLHQLMPSAIPEVGAAATAIRSLIDEDGLFFEFSHRTICSWLQNTEDLLKEIVSKPNETKEKLRLVSIAAKCWLGRLSDQESVLIAKRTISPHITGGGGEIED
jgi:MoxR-like ATPase